MPAEKKPPVWPTLTEQLRAAHASKGSALDELIRDHQEFSMLRPEEAHDNLGLPPWLRVYWRKLHPDADYSGPGGGYPLTLSDLHEWMIQHPDLRTPPADVEDPADPRPPSPYTSGSGGKGGGHGY
jgi:hypothetical protein